MTTTVMIPFTNLEIQLVRSKLDTHSDGELAAILERPIEEVHQFIDMLSGGGADARSELVQAQKEKQFKETQLKKHKSVKSSEAREERIKKFKVQEEFKNKRAQVNKKRIEAEAAWLANKKANANSPINRKFKTRDTDYSSMKSVKVGKGTWVFVDKSISDRDAIEQYRSHYDRNSPEWLKKMEAENR
jgi:acylphosphatase